MTSASGSMPIRPSELDSVTLALCGGKHIFGCLSHSSADRDHTDFTPHAVVACFCLRPWTLHVVRPEPPTSKKEQGNHDDDRFSDKGHMRHTRRCQQLDH